MTPAELHPMATGHIPSYVTQADGSDFLLTFMFVFTILVIVLIGVGYFTLHSIPEKSRMNPTTLSFSLWGYWRCWLCLPTMVCSGWRPFL
ncbi:hypothetical protein RUA4292_00351 [Ruegeria atlantica]|uniref:Uncharacterized protein n=1 Tax=Ruegeria atlantica TaxID=81569 RepID=A0A0P1ERX7_9RHOB|nr:hypothetical protein RUA4292_00351 [Ruegeria atlantica]